MTTQTVNIQITVNGANPAARAIANVGGAAQQAHRSVFNLRNLLAAFTIKSLTAAFIGFADAATRIDNRLNVLTGSVSRSNELFQALFRVSQDTRSGLESTIDAYARLERSTIGLNLTTQQLVDLTKGINQSFQIFGNSSKEAEAALVQFSQGLSVGVLRGDELRSVLEQAPRLAKAIADGLNEIPEGKELSGKFGRLFKDFQTGAISSEILAGGLRELGKEGKLTSEVITKGLLTQLPKLEEEFARTQPTIENGFTLIKNAAIDLFRSPEFKKFSGEVGAVLIQISDWITQNKALLVTIGGILMDLGRLFADLFMVAWETITGITKLFLDGVTAILKMFGLVGEGGAETADVLVKFFTGAVKGIVASVEGVFTLMARGAAYVTAIFLGVATNVKIGFQNAFNVVLEASEAVINALIDAYNFMNVFSEDLQKVDWTPGEAGQEFVDVFGEAQAAANRAQELTAQIFKPIKDGAGGAIEAINTFADRTQKRLADLANGANAVAAPLGNALNMVPGGKEVLPAEPPLDANDQRRLDSFLQRMDELNDKAMDGTDALRELTKAQDQYQMLLKDPDIAKRLKSNAQMEKEFFELKSFYTNKAFEELVAANKAEAEAAQVSLDHYNAQRLLTRELKNGLPVTQEQIDQLAGVLKEEREIKAIQQQKENVLASLTRKAEEYNIVLAATNQLLAEGKITEGQQDRFLKDTELGRQNEDINKFIGENSADPNVRLESELKALTDEQDMRMSFLEEMYAAELILKDEFEQKQTELTDIYNKQRTMIQMESQRLQYESASAAFGDMAELSKGFVKESSGVYKALFFASKAFAIADGIVKLNQAIMNASVSLPFPANIAAMAQVGAQGLSLLSAIKGAFMPDVALANGGWVSGPGGPRDDAVRAALSNGEFVVNADAASRNADLLEAINSGRFNAGQSGVGMTLNLTQNFSGMGGDQGEFRRSGRQAAEDAARAVERAGKRVN